IAGAFPLVVLIVLLGVFPRPLLTLVDGSVQTFQRVGTPAAAAREHLEVHALPVPRPEAAR
ncbi:MAG: Fe-S-binding domain-containing protein, partial [Thermoanaerobaculia bacterium]